MKLKSYGICFYKIKKIDGQNRCFLLTTKSSKKSLDGFPKGRIEKNETPKMCAIRETKEEVGLLVEEKFLENFFFQTNKYKNIGLYLVNFDNISNQNIILQKEEIYSYEWKELKDINIQNNMRHIYNNILKHFAKYVLSNQCGN